MQSSIQSHQYANAYEATQKRAHHRQYRHDTLSSHYYKKRSYVCKSNYLANLSWLILHNHSMLSWRASISRILLVQTRYLWFILIFPRMCISVEKSWFGEKLEFRSGNILLLLCAVWPVTSVLEFPVSTSTPPLIFHGHPVPDVVGEHDMQLLFWKILYFIVWVILGQTGCSSAADVMMTRPSNVLERGETKTEAWGGEAGPRASKSFTVPEEGPYEGLLLVEGISQLRI